MIVDPLTATAAELQAELTKQNLTSTKLIKVYLEQIKNYNGYLKAVIATAPVDILERRASELDEERLSGKIRGPLHGIPILIKDNIPTVPELGLPTTCGSLALVGSKPRRNAKIVDQLITAGAIIIAKANLSEWAWYRSDLAASGWSAVGGQTQSAYVRGGFRDDDTSGGHSNPGGSSSGSAVGVAAGFAPTSIGTETIGSLMMPSSRSAIYSIKPTLKIVPQDGIIPISPEADSAGPMAKSALDVADLLDILVDPSATKIPEGGYRSAITGSWGDLRIGVLESRDWMSPPRIVKYEKSATDQMLREYDAAYERLKTVAKVVKPVELISVTELTADGQKDIWDAFHYPFRELIEKYFASIDNSKVETLKDLIEFNEKHAEQELPSAANNQNGLLRGLACNLTEREYQERLRFARGAAREDGIDKTLKEYQVDIIIGPGDGPLFKVAGSAGYPLASLPLGYLNFNGRAFGLQITTKAHQDALLVQAQSAWEATFPKRRPPPLDEITLS